MLGIQWLREAYVKAVPGYDRGVTVPAIVDIPTGAVVTNDFPHITLDLEQEWTAYHRPGAPDLYPAALRDEIDEVNGDVFRDVNNGVYRCGFAGSQDAYDEAYARLFDRLDWLVAAAGGPALPGRRHDHRGGRPAVHHAGPVRRGLPRAISSATGTSSTEMPVLWAYARDLFQTPGFGDTIDFAQIKLHYYLVHTSLNPTGSSRWAPTCPAG